MDTFRWILLLIGLLIVVAVYFLSVKKQSKKDLVNNRPLINSQKDNSILFDDPEPVSDYSNDDKYEPVLDEIEEKLDVDDLDLESLFNHTTAAENKTTEDVNTVTEKTATPYLMNGNIIAFHIKPRQKESLWGNDILNVLNDYGLQHGEMNVFHYSTEGERLFSILNMVEPGSFDLSRLTAQQIPGLTAIMQLDKIDKKEFGFSTMVKKLGEMADVLDASIYDSRHEILTNQTLDVIRLAVANYAK